MDIADLDKRLWLFRNQSNKIWILTIPKWKTIFFASLDTILDDALRMTYSNNYKNIVTPAKAQDTILGV